MGLLKNNLRNLVFLMPLPIILNFFRNFNESKHLFMGFAIYISLLLACTFYFFIASEINNMLNLNSYSLSIVYFLSSFFIFDSLLLPFTKNFSFNFSVFFIFGIWNLTIFLKLKKFKPLLKILFSYLIMRIFNSIFLKDLINKNNYKELNTDVTAQWNPLASMIYENNYFFGLTNNLIEGQGLFASHVQASMLKLNFFTKNFEYIQVNSLLFIFFISFLFFDFFNNKQLRILGYTTSLALILNNDWLFYLFFNYFIEYFYQIKIKGVTYSNNLDYLNLTKDFIFLRNLNLNNILEIIFQFYVDKPLSYIYLCLIVLTIFNFKKLNFRYFLPFLAILINFIFVNLLYISHWKNVEIESSYRYINIVIYIVLVLFFKNIEKFKET